jgi:hypothetical protein
VLALPGALLGDHLLQLGFHVRVVGRERIPRSGGAPPDRDTSGAEAEHEEDGEGSRDCPPLHRRARGSAAVGRDRGFAVGRGAGCAADASVTGTAVAEGSVTSGAA